MGNTSQEKQVSTPELSLTMRHSANFDSFIHPWYNIMENLLWSRNSLGWNMCEQQQFFLKKIFCLMFSSQVGLSKGKLSLPFKIKTIYFSFSSSFSFFFFCIFRDTPVVNRDSQAWGPVGAAATSLCHSHGNYRSEPLLQRQILNPLIEARDQTCVLMEASQIHFHWAMMGTPKIKTIYDFLSEKESLEVVAPVLTARIKLNKF